MATSTTLVTFMVRTPATTRSVDLYGSWDNFSMPYTMSRDVRLGVEHWTGCHSFENIICDGNTDGRSGSRNGGLKMGGTYWYYYKLDDEIEFHNSAEPATTRCPLLPGQLVNELQVPVALSGSRNRDASVSSTSSERRTLDPDAKFTNPRPVPTPPKLVRLNTSPTLLQDSPPNANARNISNSAAPLLQANKEEQFWKSPARIFHIPRKPSLDALLKIGSGKSNTAGLRKALKMSEAPRSPGQTEKYQDIINWIPDRPVSAQQDLSSDLDAKALPAEPRSRPPPRGDLLFRSNSDDAVVTMSSFSEHRRQQSRSRSRGGSSRNSVIHDETTPLEVNTKQAPEQGPLSVLIEVNTPECTPSHGLLTGRRIALEALEGRSEGELDLGKRLPTLPNTPSSVLPPSIAEHSSQLGLSAQMAMLDSRFSATTMDTTCHRNSMITDEEHYDTLAGLNDNISWSPISPLTTGGYLSSLPAAEEVPVSPIRRMSADSAVLPEMTHSESYQPQMLSSAMSYSTVSSAISTTPTTSCGETDNNESSFLCRTASFRSSAPSYNYFQHYSLPEVEHASEITLKRFEVKDYTTPRENKSQPSQHKSSLSHSEGMQQLLDELSYLSEMIQH